MSESDDQVPAEVETPVAVEAEIPVAVEAEIPVAVVDPEAAVAGESTTESMPEPAPDEPSQEQARFARLSSILESLLFVADHPLTAVELAELVEEPRPDVIESALFVLSGAWSTRGIQLHPVAGGWQFRTHPANALWVQRLVAQKPVRLTRQQLETLAIIAYRQPITRPEIDEIRGVDSGSMLKTLLDRTLVRILGKKEEPGRPLLYGTTKEFLEFFNLRDLKELPTLREFQELSDEHRAQVEALARVAPPGLLDMELEPPVAPLPPPLARVELPEAALEEDLSEIDALITEATERARAAAEAFGAATPKPEPATTPATSSEMEEEDDESEAVEPDPDPVPSED